MTALVHDDVSKLFTVPASDWTAIDKRVGMCIRFQSMLSGPGMMPSFPALLAQSMVWRSSTFPSLVSQSGALGAYAASAIADFTPLQQRIAALDPAAASVPNDVAAAVRAALQRLHDSTVTQTNSFSALVQPIDAFRIASDGMDADLAHGSFAASFPAVTAHTAVISNAIAHVEGRWVALRDDLAGATGTIDITMPFLTSLGIAAAVASWTRIRDEAIAFGSMAAGQQQYLLGEVA